MCLILIKCKYLIFEERHLQVILFSELNRLFLFLLLLSLHIIDQQLHKYKLNVKCNLQRFITYKTSS